MKELKEKGDLSELSSVKSDKPEEVETKTQTTTITQAPVKARSQKKVIPKVEKVDPHLANRWQAQKKQAREERERLMKALHSPREKTKGEILKEQNENLEKQLKK